MGNNNKNNNDEQRRNERNLKKKIKIFGVPETPHVIIIVYNYNFFFFSIFYFVHFDFFLISIFFFSFLFFVYFKKKKIPSFLASCLAAVFVWQYPKERGKKRKNCIELACEHCDATELNDNNNNTIHYDTILFIVDLIYYRKMPSFSQSNRMSNGTEKNRRHQNETSKYNETS